MAKTKREPVQKVQKVLEPYTVRVKKEDRIVDAVFAVIAMGVAAWFIYGAVLDYTNGYGFFIVEVLVAALCMLASLFYYPRYIIDRIDVDGDTLTFTRTWFRKYTVKFKEIEDVYADGKQKSKDSPFKGSGSHAVYFVFPQGKFRLPCDFCDNWDILKKDLKDHGVAVRR